MLNGIPVIESFFETLNATSAITIPLGELLLCIAFVSLAVLFERYLLMGLIAYAFLLKWLILAEGSLFNGAQNSVNLPVFFFLFFCLVGMLLLLYHILSSDSAAHT